MKLQVLLLINLFALGLTSAQVGSTSSHGYNYGVGHHNGHGQRHTDFIHSDKHEGYSQPEHFADIQTVKVVQQPEYAQNKPYFEDARANTDTGGYTENAGADYHVAYNEISGIGAGAGYSKQIPGTNYIGLSGGYTTGLGNYGSDKEHVRVIRVIHEFSPAHSQAYGTNTAHNSKSKSAKTIKIIHEYPYSSFGGSNSKIYGGNAPTMHRISKPSYVPYDHLNIYNTDDSKREFQDSYETLNSLKAIGIFSNLGSPTSGKTEQHTKNLQYLPSPRDTFPPSHAPAVWMKKK